MPAFAREAPRRAQVASGPRSTHHHRHRGRHTHRRRRAAGGSTPRAVQPIALTQAEAAAIAYWGGVPCAGHVRIAYAPQSTAPDNDTGGVATPPLWAWATFQTPTGPDQYHADPTSYSDCVVTINQDRWPPREQNADFPDFCGLMVHEYGHFFGHPDLTTDSPSSITYPMIGPANERVPPCVHAYALFGS
jgi:hypothetical protein